MQLKQPALLDKSGFVQSACGIFTKNKERIHKFKETGDTKYIYKNELNKACFNMMWLMEILKIYREEQLKVMF